MVQMRIILVNGLAKLDIELNTMVALRLFFLESLLGHISIDQQLESLFVDNYLDIDLVLLMTLGFLFTSFLSNNVIDVRLF
jgi:hypothetical protein